MPNLWHDERIETCAAFPRLLAQVYPDRNDDTRCDWRIVEIYGDIESKELFNQASGMGFVVARWVLERANHGNPFGAADNRLYGVGVYCPFGDMEYMALLCGIYEIPHDTLKGVEQVGKIGINHIYQPMVNSDNWGTEVDR